MKQLTGSSFVVAVLATLASFACTQPVEEKSDSSQDKIIGGTVAADDAWPGIVALYVGGQQVCGGTLVAPGWVVSAGHCVIRPTAVNGGIDKVVIGRHDLRVTTVGEEINVKKATRHESYNATTHDSDISLFQLDHDSTLPVAKLIGADQASAAMQADAMTTVAGWGSTREGGSTSPVLMQVDVPIITNDVCKAFPRYNIITDSQLCAGFREGGKDSCQGDSGGPIYMKINDEWRQVGLTSWGIGCARASAPGVYTRTANHLDWLKTHSGGAIGGNPPPPPPTE
jgi:trypsin